PLSLKVEALLYPSNVRGVVSTAQTSPTRLAPYRLVCQCRASPTLGGFDIRGGEQRPTKLFVGRNALVVRRERQPGRFGGLRGGCPRVAETNVASGRETESRSEHAREVRLVPEARFQRDVGQRCAAAEPAAGEVEPAHQRVPVRAGPVGGPELASQL